jgi:hypothetical protein
MANRRVSKSKSKHPKHFVKGNCKIHGELIGRHGRTTVKCRQCSELEMPRRFRPKAEAVKMAPVPPVAVFKADEPIVADTGVFVPPTAPLSIENVEAVPGPENTQEEKKEPAQNA